MEKEVKLKIARVSSYAMLLSLLFTGCATSTSRTENTAQGPIKEVPRLKIVLACGNCQVRPNTPDLIKDGYTAAAKKSGVNIAKDREASVTIKEYVARDDTSRALVGALAGKDEIKATVAFNDKYFEVEDYYRNAWLGISSLSERIGSMIFEKIVE